MITLPTRANYDAETPYGKGYLAYTFAAWPDSEIPEESPFQSGTVEQAEYERGLLRACIAAQE